MMRYFAHYVFIYPDFYAKYCVVEVTENSLVKAIYPFVNEQERTLFFQGLLSFYPKTLSLVPEEAFDFNLFKKIESPILFNVAEPYKILYKGQIVN